MASMQSKKLAVFFDGTWNRADQESRDGRPCPTNVAKLFQATLPKDAVGTPQIIHYVKGVGTRRMERISGGGFGLGISDNIKAGYTFLASNYERGDGIYIFGFSRGAFSARSLAGMIRNLGILRREKCYLIDYAYDRYRDRAESWRPKGADAIRFRAQHTWGDETISFLGVFDTVGALGAPFGILLGWAIDKLFHCAFHDTQLSSIVSSAYHALAIDERRLPFAPTMMSPNKNHNDSNFEQKWFPGVHSDVGGGYPQAGLSDISLEWIAEKARQHGLNLALEKSTHPIFSPDVKQDLHNSQTICYRLASSLFVKLPGIISLVPKKYRDIYQNLRWNGDYVRRIDNKANLHSCVAEKIKLSNGLYDPSNIR
jgi:uncharacterized protein (DUF2235 family)